MSTSLSKMRKSMRNYEGEREGGDSDGILDREKKVGRGGGGEWD